MRARIFFGFVLLFFFTHFTNAQSAHLLGVKIAYSDPATGIYLGSPSIAKLDNGIYVASMDIFGSSVSSGKTIPKEKIFISRDRGKTWQKQSVIDHAYWSNLFVWQGKLYLMGTSGEYGNLVIRRSEDAGKTWTHPVGKQSGLLRTNEQYHTAPVPIVIHDGRIYRAVEDRHPPRGWGINFRAMVVSAPTDSDLLKASSWKTSTRLRYNQDWPGDAWLEGNVVVNPDGKVVNILRNDNRKKAGRACIAKLSSEGDSLRFNPESGFIDLPGGNKKFTIRYDEKTNKYWALTNYVPDKYRKGNPGGIRNTLALISSPDLRNWNVNKIILQSSDVQYVGFQYADWRFDGSDIIAVIRTAYPNENGKNAHSAHDSNYVMFKRIEHFRSFSDEDIKNK